MDWKIKTRELLKLIEEAIDTADSPTDLMMLVDDLASYLSDGPDEEVDEN